MNIIDRQKLLEHIDGDMELLQDAFEILLEERPVMLKCLRSAFESGDVEAVQLQAHRFKGMLANFMADVACETVVKIEQLDSAAAIADAFPLLDQLSSQLEELEVDRADVVAEG